MSEEEALELRQSEKMASRSSDLQAKLREAQETARRQSTEHEVAIGKEISARAHHQKEVKALSKQRTQDLADMVQLEQEVIALTSNFDEDGRYWEILNGAMQVEQVAQQADFSFSKDRAAGLAEVGSSMQVCARVVICCFYAALSGEL